MIANVVLVFCKGILDGHAVGRLRSGFLRVDQPAANGGEFGLFRRARSARKEGIGAAGLAAALASAPPFQIIAAFGMKLVTAADADMIAADPALAVKQRGCQFPGIVCLDFLKKLYRTNAGHRGASGGLLVGTAHRVAYNGCKGKIIMGDRDRAAF